MAPLWRYVSCRSYLQPPNNRVPQANSVQAVSLIELLGLLTSGLTGLIGLNCGFTPLPGGVVTTDSCDAASTPLCCQEPDIVRISALHMPCFVLSISTHRAMAFLPDVSC